MKRRIESCRAQNKLSNEKNLCAGVFRKLLYPTSEWVQCSSLSKHIKKKTGAPKSYFCITEMASTVKSCESPKFHQTNDSLCNRLLHLKGGNRKQICTLARTIFGNNFVRPRQEINEENSTEFFPSTDKYITKKTLVLLPVPFLYASM